MGGRGPAGGGQAAGGGRVTAPAAQGGRRGSVRRMAPGGRQEGTGADGLTGAFRTDGCLSH